MSDLADRFEREQRERSDSQPSLTPNQLYYAERRALNKAIAEIRRLENWRVPLAMKEVADQFLQARCADLAERSERYRRVIEQIRDALKSIPPDIESSDGAVYRPRKIEAAIAAAEDVLK